MTDKLQPLTSEEMQAQLDRSPFIAFLGLKVTASDPAREEVTMTLFCFSTPRILIQRCSASITQAAPTGFK